MKPCSGLFVLVVLAAVVGTSPSRGETDCKQPDVKMLLQTYRAKFRFSEIPFDAVQSHRLLSKVNGRMVQWVAIRWEGPIDGALFALDCSGHALAVANLGYISDLREGPTLISTGPTVQAQYAPGSGTGIRWREVGLFALKDSTLNLLWSHTALDSAFAMPSEDGTEDRYEWKIREDGQRIRVEGWHSVYPKPEEPGNDWGPPTTHKLPEQTYCWNEGQLRYVLCSSN